jgi:hypothetical protein
VNAPTQCPPRGLSLPVEFVRARDGDTVEVRLHGSGMIRAIRLIGCWAPELKRGPDWSRKIGYAAKEFAFETLAHADVGDLVLFVPLPNLPDGAVGLNLLSFVTFDRIPAFLYVGPHQTLNRMLVEKGLASTEKGGELGT